MAKNYKLLAESIRGRINPENFAIKRTFSDELSTISYSEVLTYVRLAMKGVEPEYTQKSRDAGEKVKEHLSKGLNGVSFKYQGSVMTDTHIKGYSDIDLLTICEKFYQYDAARVKQILESVEERAKHYQTSLDKLQKEVNLSFYSGNSLEDLKGIRADSEKILSDVYSTCDLTKPKAIKIKNHSLNREVDVVIANWYDDVTSIINDKGKY
jgi:predicted nucleotidyltransferase